MLDYLLYLSIPFGHPILWRILGQFGHAMFVRGVGIDARFPKEVLNGNWCCRSRARVDVPLGSYLHQETGSWTPIFALAIAFDGLVAFTALFVLRPLRKRWNALPIKKSPRVAN